MISGVDGAPPRKRLCTTDMSKRSLAVKERLEALLASMQIKYKDWALQHRLGCARE